LKGLNFVRGGRGFLSWVGRAKEGGLACGRAKGSNGPEGATTKCNVRWRPHGDPEVKEQEAVFLLTTRWCHRGWLEGCPRGKGGVRRTLAPQGVTPLTKWREVGRNGQGKATEQSSAGAGGKLGHQVLSSSRKAPEILEKGEEGTSDEGLL